MNQKKLTAFIVLAFFQILLLIGNVIVFASDCRPNSWCAGVAASGLAEPACEDACFVSEGCNYTDLYSMPICNQYTCNCDSHYLLYCNNGDEMEWWWWEYDDRCWQQEF